MPETLDWMSGRRVAVLVSFACALLFGLAPALQASRTDASRALGDADRRTTAGRGRAKTRAVLVVCEIALTLILLVSAGLLANSFVRLQRVDPGFRVDHVTIVTLPLPQSKYPDGKRQAAFYQRVLEGIEQRPEIESAAILFPSPIEGRTPPAHSPSRDSRRRPEPTGRLPRSPRCRPITSAHSASRSLPAGRLPNRIANRRQRWPSSTPRSRASTSPDRALWASAYGSATPGTMDHRHRRGWRLAQRRTARTADAASLLALSPVSTAVHGVRHPKHRVHAAIASLARSAHQECRPRASRRQDWDTP